MNEKNEINPHKLICLGTFAFFSVLVTQLRAWPDEVITGVIGHEKVKHMK